MALEASSAQSLPVRRWISAPPVLPRAASKNAVQTKQADHGAASRYHRADEPQIGFIDARSRRPISSPIHMPKSHQGQCDPLRAYDWTLVSRMSPRARRTLKETQRKTADSCDSEFQLDLPNRDRNSHAINYLHARGVRGSIPASPP